MRLFSLAHRLVIELSAFVCAAWHYLVSPFFGCRCRFYPSCSQYAAEALREHGIVGGAAKAARRIIRCNALSPGGYDPVLSADERSL